eukprot:TRINITY_DN6066_c0_g3_i1.p1 TRINITY_DN6066_c0_g3~~TRINITY_DN6066_c0_g3_i1.p1  ORF type:complete len:955 (+),score=174.72 TRINITY_DN6066_c0_g3_i1:82-2946(+)
MSSSASCVPVRGGGVYPLILATSRNRNKVYCAVDGGTGKAKWFSRDGDRDGVGVASEELINLRSGSLTTEGVLAYATESTAGILDRCNDRIISISKPSNLSANNITPEYTSITWSPDDVLLVATHRVGLAIHKVSNERSDPPELLTHSLQQKSYFSAAWLSSSVFLASSATGVQLLDTRSATQQVTSSSSTVPATLYNLTYNNNNFVAGVAIAAEPTPRGTSSYYIQIFDIRKSNSPQTRLEHHTITSTTVKGRSGLRALSQYSFISGISWSSCGNRLLVTPAPTTEAQNTFQTAGIVETWDIGKVVDTYSSDSVTGSDSVEGFVKGREIRAVSEQPIAGAVYCGEGNSDELRCVSVRSGCEVDWFLPKKSRFVASIDGSLTHSQPVTHPLAIVPDSQHSLSLNWSSSLPSPIDISTVMINRHPATFGTSRQGIFDALVRQGDPNCIQFGYWFVLIRRLSENLKATSGKKISLPGIVSLITDHKDDISDKLFKESVEERKERDRSNQSDGAQPTDGPTQPSSPAVAKTVLEQQFKVYESPSRKAIQLLVGWQPLSSIVESGPLNIKMVTCSSPTGFSPETVQFERLVACKVLQLKLSEAVELLTQHIQRREGSKSTYSLLVLALSSVSIGSCHAVTSWNELVSNITLTPALVASLQFLSSWNVRAEDTGSKSPWSKYSCVLDASCIDTLDKIGFASSYLDDDQLVQFCNEIAASSQHPLTSVILSGVSDTNTDALANYLDATGDVQLTAIISLAGMNYTHELTQRWVKHYRDFVLQSCGPITRCQVEIVFSSLKSQDAAAAPVQPIISLHHTMGKRNLIDSKKVLRMQRHISHLKEPPPTPGSASGGGSSGREGRKTPFLQAQCTDCRTILVISQRAASHSDKIGICNKCFAPLPKCSVCLQVTGSSTDSLPAHLTWCVSCRHGGHLEHLQNWFAVHKQCPVSDCTCQCASLDG